MRLSDNWQYSNEAILGDGVGDGPYDQKCALPWTYKGDEQTTCINPDPSRYKQDWCYYQTDHLNNAVGGQWGYCDTSDVPHGKKISCF